MSEQLFKIFSRQFKRCEGELREINCPQAYIDVMSKYYRFLQEDVINVKENGNGNRLHQTV